MTGLDKIIEKINDDAKERANKCAEGAEMEISHMKAMALEEMMRMEKIYSSRCETVEIEAVKRARSSSEMIKRDAIVKKKSEMIDTAFENAILKILSMPTEKYVSFMAKALSYVVNKDVERKKEILKLYGEEEADIGAGYEVIFNAEDVKSGKAKKIFDKAVSGFPKDIKIVISKADAKINGGFILKCKDVETNCSVTAMVHDVRLKCDGKVAKKLFGN